eukprot:TRINITY_DN6098_c0_g1_i1.p1 TRINITY_DN6098_c0_g1~~TRINITY_DN6098_c0_g1_i1.p1  ORF type:complete len:563 (+),score=91.90 TRINITY_DN6098_c0_g1_i1:106-1794(+)
MFCDVLDDYQGLVMQIYDLIFVKDDPLCAFGLCSSLLEWKVVCLEYTLTKDTASLGMKYTLEVPALVEVLGEGMISLLRILVGPAIGMNLRNILWHGCFNKLEFGPHNASFMLLIMMSVSRIVKRSTNELESIRTQTDFSWYTRCFEYWEPGLLWGDDFTLYMESLEELLRTTRVIIPSRIPNIMNAFGYLCKNDRNLVYFTIGILPELEHILRLIFVAVNDVPTDLARAQYLQHFTILDTFLDKKTTIEGEVININIEDNVIISALGEPYMDLVFDLFRHPDGPRCRDKLSHGEAILSSLTPELVDRLITAFIYLLLKYNTNENPEQFNPCLGYVDNYLSCFHPKALLQQSLETTYSHLAELDRIIQTYPYRDELKGIDPNEAEFMCRRRNDPLGEIVTAIAQSHTFQLDQKIEALHLPTIRRFYKLKTMYRPNAELSKVTALKNICDVLKDIIQIVSDKIIEYKESADQQSLTSRAEKSYYKLLGLLDAVYAALNFFCKQTEYELLNEKPFPTKPVIKYLNNQFTLVKRIKSKLESNEWSFIVTEFHGLNNSIKKKYNIE